MAGGFLVEKFSQFFRTRRLLSSLASASARAGAALIRTASEGGIGTLSDGFSGAGGHPCAVLATNFWIHSYVTHEFWVLLAAPASASSMGMRSTMDGHIVSEASAASMRRDQGVYVRCARPTTCTAGTPGPDSWGSGPIHGASICGSWRSMVEHLVRIAGFMRQLSPLRSEQAYMHDDVTKSDRRTLRIAGIACRWATGWPARKTKDVHACVKGKWVIIAYLVGKVTTKMGRKGLKLRANGIDRI